MKLKLTIKIKLPKIITIIITSVNKEITIIKRPKKQPKKGINLKQHPVVM